MLGHCLEGEVDTRTLGDIVADEMNIRRKFSRFVILSGATDWDRTSNLRLRRPTLYPIELQSRQNIKVFQKFVQTLCKLSCQLGTIRTNCTNP